MVIAGQFGHNLVMLDDQARAQLDVLGYNHPNNIQVVRVVEQPNEVRDQRDQIVARARQVREVMRRAEKERSRVAHG